MYVFHYYYFRHATSLISIESGQEKIITVFTIISQTAHLQLTVVSMTFLEVCIHNLQILFTIILFIFIKQFWKEGLNALLNLFYSLNWLLDTYRFMMSNHCWFTTNSLLPFSDFIILQKAFFPDMGLKWLLKSEWSSLFFRFLLIYHHINVRTLYEALWMAHIAEASISWLWR